MPVSDDVIFHEQGASWRWLLMGPLAAVAMLWIQHGAGMGVRLLVPGFFLVLLSGILYLLTFGFLGLGVLYDFWTLNDQVSLRNAQRG